MANNRKWLVTRHLSQEVERNEDSHSLSPFFHFLQSDTQNRVVLPTFRVGDQGAYKSSQVDNEDESPLISQTAWSWDQIINT